ncbi:MAG: amidase, partial [Clostridia bacterium]|nr:amidase [Clostridia bacterium]
MKDILKMDIMTLHKHIANKEISCMEITAAYLQNIEKKDEKIKAYITVTKEEAEKRAKSLDERLSLNSNIPLLYGIPGALKDNICTKGILTTCASKMLCDFIPPYNATVYEKLNDNGMILLGKLNMDEFAMGSTTTTSYFHKTYNPYDLSKSCGGSSGGSAAAVASEQTLFALGSDTGGSIRQPASFCNVVGMKPTYGTISRYGLIAFASSLDQIGPMTRTVYDNALILDAISGYDKKDSTSVMKPSESYTDDIGKDIKNMKMGLIRQFNAKKFDSQVDRTVKEAIN